MRPEVIIRMEGQERPARATPEDRALIERIFKIQSELDDLLREMKQPGKGPENRPHNTSAANSARDVKKPRKGSAREYALEVGPALPREFRLALLIDRMRDIGYPSTSPNVRQIVKNTIKTMPEYRKLREGVWTFVVPSSEDRSEWRGSLLGDSAGEN